MIVCTSVLAQAQLAELVLFVQSFNLGNKTELLVTVKQGEGPEGATNITVTTDQPSGMVMHWGVRKQGKGEWLAPPQGLIPQGSEQATETAWDTPLQAADSIEVQGDKVQLQRAVIEVPAEHDLTGLTFVCKSKDGTMWWRDGECTSEHRAHISCFALYACKLPQFACAIRKGCHCGTKRHLLAGMCLIPHAVCWTCCTHAWICTIHQHGQVA